MEVSATAGKLEDIPTFCARNGISRQTFYNLQKVGRGPKVIRMGRRVLVSPEAETAWRRRMEDEPINGSILAGADHAVSA